MSNAEEGIDGTIKQIHVLCEQMVQMNELVKEVLTKMPQGQHVTMTHKTEGLGMLGVVASAFAFCCLLGVAGLSWMVSIELNKQTADLHDLRAWRDIHNNDISTLKSKVATISEKR